MTLLAIHPGALGDMILFGHLVKMLGGAETFVGGGEKASLLAGLGVAERAVAFDGLPMHEIFADTPLGDCRLPAMIGGHDRLLSCFGDGDTRAQMRLAAMAGVDSASFLPVRPPQEFAGHLLELWCDLLGVQFDLQPQAWSVPPEWCDAAMSSLKWCDAPMASLRLAVSQKSAVERAWPIVARKALEQLETTEGETPSRRMGGTPMPRQDAGGTPATHGGTPMPRIAVIHPGAGGRAKCWPVERFVAVGEWLQQRGVQVVWVVGPVEMETWPAESLAAMSRGALLQSPPLTTLAGLVSRACVFIGNDSGPAHLAAAVGTRTVALFGATSAAHFRPVGPHVATVVADAMEGIEPSQVIAAIEAIVK